MNMDKEQVIAHLANDMINGLNIHQIVSIIRQFAVEKAGEYYDDLSQDQIDDLIARFAAQQDALNKAEEAQEQEPAAEPVKT